MRRLILRPGAVGDFIVSLPAMESLAADYLEVWTTQPNLPLVHFADHAESLYSTGIDVIGIEGQALEGALAERLAGFEDIVSWYGANRPEFRQAVSHLPFRFFPALPGAQETLHAVDYYLAQLGAPLGAKPRLPMAHVSEHFLAIHPFSGSKRKNWPLSRFREVAARSPLPAHWTAGPEEELPEAIMRFVDLGSLAEWLSRGEVFLGNDSGVGHLAAAAGTPVISIFGETNPRIWAPRGDSVIVVQAGSGKLEDVSVGQVLDAIAASTNRRP